MRLLCVLFFLSVSGMAFETDEEQAHRCAITALDDYQDCLTEEYEKVARARRWLNRSLLYMSAGLAFRTGKAVARKYSIFLTVQFPMMKQRL
jgi:hypothetical protein